MRTKLAAITLAALALLAVSARDVVAGEDGRRSGRGKGRNGESRRSDDGRRDRDRADTGRVIVVERDDHGRGRDNGRRKGQERARGRDSSRRHGQERARGHDKGRRHDQERDRGHDKGRRHDQERDRGRDHGRRRVTMVAKHRRPMPRPSRSAYWSLGHRACRYVEGRYVFEMRQIFIPGAWREERVAPVYREHRGRFGIVIRIMVKPGYTHRTFEPGHYEHRNVRVWVPGYWVCHR